MICYHKVMIRSVDWVHHLYLHITMYQHDTSTNKGFSSVTLPRSLNSSNITDRHLPGAFIFIKRLFVCSYHASIIKYGSSDSSIISHLHHLHILSTSASHLDRSVLSLTVRIQVMFKGNLVDLELCWPLKKKIQ